MSQRTILTLPLTLILLIYTSLATAYALYVFSPSFSISHLIDLASDTHNAPVSPPPSNLTTSTTFIAAIDVKWYLGALFILALYAAEGVGGRWMLVR